MKMMKHMRKAVERTLEDPTSPYFSFVNDTLAAATFVSVLAIVLETVPAFAAYHTWFVVLEWVTVGLFLAEYIARICVTRPAWSYAVSFFGIVDLLAILPTFLGLGNFTFLKSARIVRLMRFLRMIRVAKMSRMKKKDIEETMGVFGFNILLYAVTLIFTMVVIGALLHTFMVASAWSIPQGMYWAFSVFLGGLPAPIPPGTEGTLIFIFTKFCGMILFGLLVGVVGKVFNQLILGKA